MTDNYKNYTVAIHFSGYRTYNIESTDESTAASIAEGLFENDMDSMGTADEIVAGIEGYYPTVRQLGLDG